MVPNDGPFFAHNATFLSHVVNEHLTQNTLGFMGSALTTLVTAKFEGARRTALTVLAQSTVTQNTEVENRDIEVLKMKAGMEQNALKAVMDYLLFEATNWLFAEDSPTTIVRNLANKLYDDMNSVELMDYYIAALGGDAGFEAQLAFVRNIIAATARFDDEDFRSRLSENTSHLPPFLSGQDVIGYYAGAIVPFLVDFAIAVHTVIQGDRAYYNANNLYTLKEIERHLMANVPPGDVSLVEVNRKILAVGQGVYGDTWNRENFGIGATDVAFADRLCGAAVLDLRRWPPALRDAAMMWHIEAGLGANPVGMDPDSLKEFWQSDFIPSALRKTRGWFIDPHNRILFNSYSGRKYGTICPEFDLESIRVGTDFEYIFDSRTGMLIGHGEGNYVCKNTLLAACECEEKECADDCECENCTPTEPTPEPRPCPPGCRCGVCRAMREADGEELRARDVISPLVIDLSRTGITKIGKENGVHFDLGNTGFAQRTA